jgi:hypothetical protein
VEGPIMDNRLSVAESLFGDMTCMKMTTHRMILLSGLLVLFALAGCSTSGSKADSSPAAASTARNLSDAKLLYELGKLDMAEQKLDEILRTEPGNPAAVYLLCLVRDREAMRDRGLERPWGYIQTDPPQPIYR